MEKIDFSGFDIPEKEKKILEAAINVFSEKGFSAATTNEIAKNAGVAEGTIFRYFKTKKDILRGILIHTLNMFSEKIVIANVEKLLLESEDKDIRVILKEIVYDRIKLLESIFPMARIIITEAMYHEDLREAIYKNIIEKALEIFKLFHKKMVDKGVIRKDIGPEVILRCVMGNIMMLIAQRMLYRDKLDIPDLDTEIDKMIDVIVLGISEQRRE